MRLLWLAAVARDAGLDVVEDPGWTIRGAVFNHPIRGVITHHTATAASAPGDYPSLRLVREGRPDLLGPLSQYGLGRSGAVYVIASGRANHAGPGSWPGITGNADTIGIEAEHPGTHVAWPTGQYAAYAALCAAIADHLDLPTSRIIGHKEWAPTRKIDPTFHMGTFRVTVEQQRKKEELMTPTQARIEVATAWYQKAGVWMDGIGTQEDPQARLTRLAKEVVDKKRTAAQIAQHVTRVRAPVLGEAVPAWVLDPTSPFAPPITGGGTSTIDTIARQSIAALRNHLRGS